ncbi:methylated-DNA--[protein]-cysteine S-methyltransferase [Methylosinus sp. H3A]|uniref:methylated-DNA--[protein]-cysteine S-methyltransferase n=1 Tax=Methylosinus sp. H3A TaxID=2785786 RepID=UPI0018C219C4|nr:methylated-DNA--[protein]-cysteine S-methyltransferase [Methylosinus sp. H3A]MBG0809035.1 methylated-DNA--[protein]-cysteine S-methyltransferase [Methylosinus sp. H3A]
MTLRSASYSPTLPAPADRWPEEDYATVVETIRFLGETGGRPPSVAETARAVGLAEPQLRVLLRRWAGLSPEAFLEASTPGHIRALLDASPALGAARASDLFIACEAPPVGAFERGGAGLAMGYGFHPSPFGEAVLIATELGLMGLGFVEGAREAVLEDFRRRWPKAGFSQDQEATAPFALRVFDPAQWRPERPLRLAFLGSAFDVAVWEALLSIEMRRATTYGAIAAQLGKPRAARAVGAAVGRNPVSFVAPCHRVFGASGALTGYHWGLTRKQAIIAWEAGLPAG